MPNGDQLLRGYARLNALRANLPERYEVEESWVHEFHAVVASMEAALAIDLAEFRVPEKAIARSISSGNYLTGKVTYRDGLWCERSVLMQKVDSLLLYFSGLQSGDEKRIGFHVP